jgi:hypothetical protein
MGIRRLLGFGSKKEKPDTSRPSPTAPSLTSSSNEIVAPPSSPAAAFPDKDQAKGLRSDLQKQLGREVSVWGEGSFRKVARAATNPYLVLGAATVGVGVAGVLTAGTAHVVLGAVAAGQLSSTGSKAFEWWKSKKQGTVHLDQGAVVYLLSKTLPDRRVKAVQAALSGMPGDAYITKQQLIDASAKPHSDRRPSRAVHALRSPYGRAGLALLSAGLLLIAVTVIPEYIHDPSLRVAVVVSAIGGILIATAMIEAFKGALMGSSDP